MKKDFLLLLISLVITSACSNQKDRQATVTLSSPSRIVGIGKITPRGGVSELASPASGIVTKVCAQPGDTVKEGDLLLLLDMTDEMLSVKESDARIISQQNAVGSAAAALEHERISLAEKLRLLTDARELLEAGAATGEDVRKLQNEYDKGSELLKKIENDYREQQAQLKEITIQRSSRIKDLARTRLQAPFDGILLDITPRAGEALSLYETYGRIAPDAPLIVMAEIDELYARDLALGMHCTINLPGDSAVTALGEILHISPYLKRKSLFSDSGNELEDRRIREIEVSLHSMRKDLLIDTKVECTVYLN
ncbi:MAG: efflux RND transporter periplasmic adaptor subunit [Proteiniphilum sp.]|nr:efflux RND transporter periplasmic adaptor subunit [Proteiniphilum sp.]MDD4416828.1 efflux RND transporter periplasmic adaptor subunit [Proteiniphilum sp.]